MRHVYQAQDGFVHEDRERVRKHELELHENGLGKIIDREFRDRGITYALKLSFLDMLINNRDEVCEYLNRYRATMDYREDED